MSEKRKPGRPPGAKNKRPSNTSKMLVSGNNAIVDNSAIISASRDFEKQLHSEVKKLYKLYNKCNTTSLDNLKDLARDMLACYKLARQTELNAYAVKISNAKKTKDIILETRRINGRVATDTLIKRKCIKLDDVINSSFKISSTLTTLASEIKSVNVEIERIESGTTTQTVNIFNILKGKEDPKLTQELKKELFTPTKDIFDPEDAEWRDMK